MKKILLTVISCLLSTLCFPQYYTARNKVWAFGNNAGINFNSGTPVSFPSCISTMEGCAAVCNTGGAPLFFTDGKKIYDRTGNLMPHGSDIVPIETFSTRDAAVIVPNVLDTTLFYIFSLENMETAPYGGRLMWGIVDMKLNSGLGDMDTDNMAMPLADSLSEGMCAIRGNNHNVWLVAHDAHRMIFKVYEINATGIHGPITSTIDTYITGYAYGAFATSPDRRKIAFGGNGILFYNFDAFTGNITNAFELRDTNSNDIHELCFSPDSKKLYVASFLRNKIIQYNLTSGDTTTISASATFIATTNAPYRMRLGTDHKMYMRNYSDTHYLNCINSPNIAGVACHFTANQVALSSGTTANWGLPSIVVNADTILETTEAVEDEQQGFRKTEIQLYPIPAKSSLTISCNTIIWEAELKTIDGRNACNIAPNQKQAIMNLTGLPNDIYYIRINRSVSYMIPIEQ